MHANAQAEPDAPSAVDGQTVAWVLSQLRRRQRELERAGAYEEADEVSASIEKLETYEEINKREQLRTLHLLQRLCVADSHKEERTKFQIAWVAAMERELRARHHRELVVYVEKISCDAQPRAPRWSAKLLALRKQESLQAKAKNYRQAKKTKEAADALEMRELHQWKRIRDAQIQRKEEAWRNKQKLEMQGLLARIESGRRELLRTRDAAQEILIRRYANVVHQLEKEQKITTLKTFPRSRSRLSVNCAAEV
ncbi:hypothetical protein BESB_083220 [Besnoitia besnoiti]|uniref:Uncharacterized protein n=1 Tax=Besnoitia besnoiti TaxID=94643 RepID=A0A2A9MBS1_BESBE|nr:hypothetical protein BESB_083220 [Besnoitia besnoiti]PFH33123.1 hypothetical protein BESB_083220 [Besnoitia besnoiti]